MMIHPHFSAARRSGSYLIHDFAMKFIKTVKTGVFLLIVTISKTDTTDIMVTGFLSSKF